MKNHRTLVITFLVVAGSLAGLLLRINHFQLTENLGLFLGLGMFYCAIFPMLWAEAKGITRRTASEYTPDQTSHMIDCLKICAFAISVPPLSTFFLAGHLLNPEMLELLRSWQGGMTIFTFLFAIIAIVGMMVEYFELPPPSKQ